MPISVHPSRSEFLSAHGLRHHIRRWGTPGAPRLFLQHGWMDHSATFQFMVDALAHDWDIIAPDWRGFGASQHNTGSYFAADYLADLDAILEHYSPQAPVRLVGHSMGGMVASLYAGIRPERVAALVSIEGFGLPATSPDEAPARYARWLAQKRSGMRFGPIGDLQALVAKMLKRQPFLRPDRAAWLAGHWTETGDNGELRYRADPKHKMVNPVLYRLEEARACWRHITCPVLWLAGDSPEPNSLTFNILELMRERRDGFADLREASIANAGHMVQQDQPEAVAAAVEAFLLETTAYGKAG
ncbi:pimeloyl-ACP methyl ester carboxylesterase [Microvirgula sp. AG722]|uniref:alpha/beta fold hydrolase n=1 Tax=Microvirgula sp. AG722 TaxID=2183901 RepID=UPI000DC5C3C2|nr:alpha/beta hydrolase [Microvirgula sp. AG722]RAS15984.1 pimeloyl-ACP methyl ester carboxylesterase [Microvirgula sp. AG722]